MSGQSCYRWVVTKDLLEGRDVRVEGPSNLDPSIPLTHRFRMLDDDGEVYYEGEMGEKGSRPDCFDLSETGGFGPLDDFGAPNAGCTEIQYWNPEIREWVTL